MEVFHFVCTHQEAEELIRAQAELWISDCGCRASAKDKCRSRTDLCLAFFKEPVSGGANLRPAKLADALEVLAETDRHHLVTRPFTDGAGKVKGMCICCDCHCDYFHDPSLAGSCAPGRFVAVSDEATCDGCGVCVPVCYFGARSKEGALVDSARCAGCGLCVEVCPAGATAMEKREAAQA
jgi:electron transport complex protein RnfB